MEEGEFKMSIPGYEKAVMPRDRFAALRSYFDNKFRIELQSDDLTTNDVHLYREFVRLARNFGHELGDGGEKELYAEIEQLRQALHESAYTKDMMASLDEN